MSSETWRVTVDGEDLEPTEQETHAGAVSAFAIHVKRLTIVVLETEDGVMSAGLHASWPGSRMVRRVSLEKARARAVANLEKARTAQHDFKAERGYAPKRAG